MTVTASLVEGASTLEFLDTDDVPIADADSALAGHQIDINAVETVVHIKVTANESTSQTYTVTITRANTERDALMALYNATDGPNWTTSTNWNTNEPISTWYGVGAGLSGWVESLSLSGNGLSGTIPAELGNLLHFTDQLQLNSNLLTGPIPPELGNLTELQELTLNSNRLSGPIPPELGRMTRLAWLYLYDNTLTGSVPAELGLLPSLSQFIVTDNALTGCIPAALRRIDMTFDAGITYCDAPLSALTVESASLSPAFSPASVAYTAAVSAGTTQVTISVEAADSFATIRYLDTDDDEILDADGTTDGHQINVADGDTVKVEVSASQEVQQTYTVTIRYPPVVVVGDVSVDEGAGAAVFAVSLAAGSGPAVSLDYRTGDGTAAAPGDYGHVSGSIVVAPGGSAVSVSVSIVDDALYEPDEAFTLVLESADAAVVVGGDLQAQATITDDDPPVVVVGDVSVGEGAGAAVFAVSLAAGSGPAVSLDYRTGDGTAVAPGDYGHVSGSIVVAPGGSAVSVSVSIVDDAVYESDEAFTLVLESADAAVVVGGDLQAQATITDDDPEPVVLPVVSIAELSVGESVGMAWFDVVLSKAATGPVTVLVSTFDGTAVAGSDYVALSGLRAAFTAGESSLRAAVEITDDSDDEDGEWFTLALSEASGATVGTPAVMVTIIDNDPPVMSVADIEVGEGAGPARFLVRLDAASALAAQADYSVAAVTAEAADFASDAELTGTVRFEPGEIEKWVDVGLHDDAVAEDDETFTLTLSQPQNTVVGRAVATATITDDDLKPTLFIGPSAQTVREDAAEDARVAVVTVTLSEPSEQTVTFSYRAGSPTRSQRFGTPATAGADFEAQNATLEIAAGATSAEIRVPVHDDALDEDRELFAVDLVGTAVNASVRRSSARVFIEDDDEQPSVSVFDVEVDESAGRAEFAVGLSAPSGRTIRVNYETSDGTATADDYGATATGFVDVPPGVTVASIEVTVADDSLDEDDETFTLTLTGADFASLVADASTATATITDDDSAPEVSIADVSVDESAGPVTLSVTLSHPSIRTITVEYRTIDVTASSGSGDYTAVSSARLEVPPHQTDATVAVEVLDDDIDEAVESFNVALVSAVNATIADGSAYVNITDNDEPPAVSIAATATTAAEGLAATLTVRLSTASGQSVTVYVATSDGTATASVDYGPPAAPAVFAPGQTEALISIPTIDDSIDEEDETFTVAIASAQNATIATNTLPATVTITDGDDPRR